MVRGLSAGMDMGLGSSRTSSARLEADTVTVKDSRPGEVTTT